MKYRNRIPEPGTTISGFADSKKKMKKKIMMPTDRPIFLTCDSKHTYFFFGLSIIFLDIYEKIIDVFHLYPDNLSNKYNVQVVTILAHLIYLRCLQIIQFTYSLFFDVLLYLSIPHQANYY